MVLALVVVAARCFWLMMKKDPVRCFQVSMKLYLESGVAEAVRMAIVKAFLEFQYEEAEEKLLKIIREHHMGM